MEPRVSKRDRRLHLSYQVSHRIHCSLVYPVLAPNGSTLLLYGYDNGLRVLWRGGKRLRDAQTPRLHRPTNGASESPDDVIVIDDDDEEDAEAQDHGEDGDYESVEDVQDSEHSFPSIIQEVEVEMDTAVLQMAVPTLMPATATQSLDLVKSHAIIALTCTSGEVLVLSIPLAPPKSSSIPEFLRRGITQLQLDTNGSLPSCISVKLLPKEDGQPPSSRARQASVSNSDVQGRLIVAANAKRVQLWTIDLTSTFMSTARSLPSPVLRSPLFGTKMAFHPSSKSSELLFADRSGMLRIYDPLAPSSDSPQPSSKFVMSLSSPSQNQADSSFPSRRKPILGAEWILGGRGIMVLLEDGEWGIWDFRAEVQQDKSVEDFALHGYLVSSSNAELRDDSKQQKGPSKLAPMTPNTRKARAGNLFSSPSRAQGASSNGGISVLQNSQRTGTSDESVLLWYNGEIYSIASTRTFMQRNSPNKSGGLGGLYAPALTHVSNIDLMNEQITSVSQLASHLASTADTAAQMNTQHDFLVSAEHRFLIVHSRRFGNANLFQQHIVERPAVRDQRMLDVGELDLVGMDRMLDSMASEAGARRVAFVQ